MKSLLLPFFTVALLSATVARADKAEVLFDGSTLDAFEFKEGGWVIEKDGSMSCRMEEVSNKKGEKELKAMGYIWTRKDYSDFALSLSYKLSDSANSGVFYRSDKDNAVQGGFEIQLMDNEGFQKLKGMKLEDSKLNGSFYGGKAPSSDPSNPIGEWNTFDLVCKGPIVKVSINGEEIVNVNVDDWDTAGENPDGTPNKFKTAFKDLPRTGQIGFQNHGQVVWFKDVKIRDLAKK
jgi:hypothetical protein